MPSNPSYIKLIVDAIKQLKVRGGSSRQSIKKYILENNKELDANVFDRSFKTALARGVSSNMLIKNGVYFRVSRGAKQLPVPKKVRKPVVAKKRVKKAPPVLKVKKLSANATLPKQATSGSAGYDLAAAHDAIVPAHGKALISTDLAFTVPIGCYGRISPRSGLAWKNSIDVLAGVIDRDYCQTVGVILFNHSDTDFVIKQNDRIAQLILEKIEIAEVEEVSELQTTDRVGGFGSTGITSIISV